MKQSRNIGILLLTSVALLSACANKKTSTDSKKSDDGGSLITSATTITIKSTFNDTYRALFDSVIEKLKESEPLLTIENVKYSGGYSDLASEVVKGIPVNDYPDLVVSYPDSVNDYILAGAALDITPYMNGEHGWSEEEKADIYSAYLKEGQDYVVEGTYSLPLAKSTEAMYYNAEKIIGLNLSSYDATINNGKPLDEAYINNLTWEEFFDKLCPAIVKYNAANNNSLFDATSSDWAVLGYDSDDNLFITLAEQYGYGYTSIDTTLGVGKIDFVNDGMKSLMKKFNQAAVNHYITTKGYLGGSTYVNTLATASPQRCLFSIGSTGGTSYQYSSTNPMELNVAPIPQAAGKDSKVISQGPSVAFLDHKDNNRALGAWLFYKALTDTDSATRWSLSTNYMPIRESVSTSDDFLEAADYTACEAKTLERLKAKAFAYAGEVGNSLFTSPVFKGSSEARTQAGNLMTGCLKLDPSSKTYESDLNTLFDTAYQNTILKM